MRENLAKRSGQKIKIRAYVSKFGSKQGYNGKELETICFKDIIDAQTGNPLCDHIWFAIYKKIKNLKLELGDYIQFEATVNPYYKGYYKDILDYKLSYPSKIIKLRKRGE